MHALELPDAEALLRRLDTPPPDVLRVLGLTECAPLAAALAHEHGLNAVAAEALAIALSLDAVLFVTAGNDGPRLRSAAQTHHVAFEVVDH